MKYIPLLHEETQAAKSHNNLLEGDETGRVSGTDTGPSVLDGLAMEMLAIHLCGRVYKSINVL